MNTITRTIACFAILVMCVNAQAATIIGGTTGDGDFEVPEPIAGAKFYTESPNWFNASGSEGINFTNDSQTGGSSQGGSRAGMPFNNRVQVNNTGHTISAAGEIFSLSYDFGAGGALAHWNGDETMRTFLFTATVPVNGDLTTADMTELGGDLYAIDRANDGQWTTRTVPVLYTSTAADAGKTVYFGMEFEDASGNTLFPRLDVVQLDVTAIPEPTSIAMLVAACLLGGNRLRRRTM
jgi:hypothetical protein